MPVFRAINVPQALWEHSWRRFGILNSADDSGDAIGRRPTSAPPTSPFPPLPMSRLIALSLCLCLARQLFAVELAAPKIDFNHDIRPILSNQCAKCHGPDPKERKGGTDGLRLDVRDDAIADLGGYAAIVPGHPEKSALVERITSRDDEERMPPKAR